MCEDCLILETDTCKIEVCDEPLYTPNSTDNERLFDKQLTLDEEGYIVSARSVVVNCYNGESRSCILLAGGGPASLDDNSAFVYAGGLVVAVGNLVCRLSLPELDLEWKTKVDFAACFGIYHSPEHACYVSHGEVDITRLNYNGKIVWVASGKDIFSAGFYLGDDFIDAVDFNGERYRIEIETGTSKLVKA